MPKNPVFQTFTKRFELRLSVVQNKELFTKTGFFWGGGGIRTKSKIKRHKKSAFTRFVSSVSYKNPFLTDTILGTLVDGPILSNYIVHENAMLFALYSKNVFALTLLSHYGD